MWRYGAQLLYAVDRSCAKPPCLHGAAQSRLAVKNSLNACLYSTRRRRRFWQATRAVWRTAGGRADVGHSTAGGFPSRAAALPTCGREQSLPC